VVFSRMGFSAALLAATVLVFCGVLLTATPSEAQDLDCSDFDSREDAQEELERNPGDPSNLDNDNDGIACESLPSRGGEGGDANGTSGDLDCSDFGSQEEAQNELEDNPSDPNNLDADNDGTACESLSSGSADGNDEADRWATPGTQEDQDGEGGDGTPASQSTARAGGAFAQSSSEEGTTERRNRGRRDRVVKGTVPNKPLPPTGGLPGYVAVTGPLLASVGLLGIGLLVRRAPRG
jgi:hypothetical protein